MALVETKPGGVRSVCRFLVCAATLLVGVSGCAARVQWLQWGGPNRNFMVETKGLADKWPEEGPKKLWHRELGDGHSTIVVDKGVLYTMYRAGTDEFTVALDAKTGETIWEHKNPSPFTPLMAEYGAGPHSTPLISGNRLYAIGTNAVMHCFDRRNGKILWKRDLAGELGAPIPEYGYACSPIVYRTTVIVPVDRERPEDQDGSPVEEEETADVKHSTEGQSLIAFDRMSGDVVWKALDLPVGYSSPLLISLDGEEQLVLFTTEEVVGINPGDGALLWRHAHKTQYGANISTPLWNGEDLIFSSAAYGSGSRVIRLTRKDGRTAPKELWHSRKMRIHHGNAIRIGDYVYGSSGDFGPALFVSLNIKTGKVVWRERGFKKATCVYGEGKLIILDEDGQLALATATPEGLRVHSKCKITEYQSWTAPTLVGTTLYVRDRKTIMALDLG